MTEGNIFSLSTLWGGGGYPISGLDGWEVPFPRSRREEGYPIPGPDEGVPPQSRPGTDTPCPRLDRVLGIPPCARRDGVPPIQDRIGHPPPIQDWMGSPLPISKASTCYAAGGVPQEDFLDTSINESSSSLFIPLD